MHKVQTLKKGIRKGFTLIEIILAMAIISVLGAIIVFIIRPANIFKSADTIKIENDKLAIESAYTQYRIDDEGTSPFGEELEVGILYKICKEAIPDCAIDNYELSLAELINTGLLSEIPEYPNYTNERYTGYLLYSTDIISVIVTDIEEAEITAENASPGDSFEYEGISYEVVEGAGEELWLDRNLGASAQATSQTDANAYGYLYQWGRDTDGHQIRTSVTAGGPSSSETPGTNFLTKAALPYNWYNGANPDDFWQPEEFTNNPCPTTWKVPTEEQWQAEIEAWTSQNIAGAISSPLKLVLSGRRDNLGNLQDVASIGNYWADTNSASTDKSKSIRIDGSSATSNNLEERVEGLSVRCIKDPDSVIPDGGGTANYALQENSQGECTGALTINGDYEEGKSLTPSETIEVGVFVSIPGTYYIVTNTVNNYSFSKSGTFESTGNTTVILNNAGGTPTVEGTNTFNASAGITNCTFEVEVQDSPKMEWKNIMHISSSISKELTVNGADLDYKATLGINQAHSRVMQHQLPLAVGANHTCILKTNGNVDCYGSNSHGQAADYNGGNAIGIATGEYNTCALLSTGNIDCWGRNDIGQSADYSGGNAVGVAAGYWHSCALLSDGNTDCWGWNGYNQVIDYASGDAVAIATGREHTCILKTNGNVDCYGSGTQATDYNGADAIGIAAGVFHTCILKLNGNVDCYGWASNDHGQLAEYVGGDAIGIAGGFSGTCILKSNGNTDCYGNNAAGQIIDSTSGDVIGVGIGWSHSCILKTNKNIDCSGDNTSGQAADYNGGDAKTSF